MQVCRIYAKSPLGSLCGSVPWLQSPAQPYPHRPHTATGRGVHSSHCTRLSLRHIIYAGRVKSHQAVSTDVSATVTDGSQHQPPALRTLYPASAPYTSGYLKVTDLHSIYYEIHGNPRGVPAVVVHGGPGAGCFPNHARFFDAQYYRIILLDQRGCGRSNPSGCLFHNATSDLVDDLEALRKHLGVEQWLMLGGSWGVALSIAYAQAHPQAVQGLVLRGVCLMRPEEIQWMYGGGAAALKPLAWHQFVSQLPARERGNPVLGYYKRLLSADPAVRTAAAKTWMSWEMAVGFSGQQNLLVWDGHDWASLNSQQQQQQQQQQPAPPPKPTRSTAAAAAAVPVDTSRWRSDIMPQLQAARLPPHGRKGPAPSSDESSSSSNSSSSSLVSDGRVVSPSGSPPPAMAAATTGLTSATACRQPPAQHQALQQSVAAGDAGLSGTSTTSNKPISNRSSFQQGSVSGEQHHPSWLWGLPGQGFNMQDPEVQQLVWHGLNHQGFGSQGFGVQALLECHYSLHGAFLLDQPLLDHIDRIRHIPCIAVQGQLDFVCPPSTAFDLHKVWPEMELRLVAGSGHSMYDPGITHELVLATARMKGLLPGAGRDSAGRSAAAVAGDGGVAPAVNSGGGSAAGGQQDVPGGGPRAAAIRRDMTNSSIDKQVTRGRSRRHGGH